MRNCLCSILKSFYRIQYATVLLSLQKSFFGCGTDFSVFLILSEIQILRDHEAYVQYEATCLLNSFLRIG